MNLATRTHAELAKQKLPERVADLENQHYEKSLRVSFEAVDDSKTISVIARVFNASRKLSVPVKLSIATPDALVLVKLQSVVDEAVAAW